MAFNFKFPDVGEGITEGEIVKWKVKLGDSVKADQSIAEVETDKAIVEIPSPHAGIILKINHKEGETIKVGEVLAVIGKKGEKLEEFVPMFEQITLNIQTEMASLQRTLREFYEFKPDPTMPHYKIAMQMKPEFEKRSKKTHS